jgi:hypothetical protein
MNFKKVSRLAQAFVVLFASASLAGPSDMVDRLASTGEGQANPNYGQRIKNIMIFQADGWEGLLSTWNPSDLTNANPTWPLHFGKKGYLSKDSAVLTWQMHEITALGGTTAVAQLILPDSEANASGKGACWGGDYVGRDANNQRACSNGATWRFPKAFMAEVKYAAWMKGVQVAPLFSINNYEWPAEQRAAHAADAVQKLKDLVAWYRQSFPGDAVTLMTTSGKRVILTEGLPENTGLSTNATARADLCNYMASQTDIFWIDNLLNADTNPNTACPATNVYRSAAAPDANQQVLRSAWGSRYLYTYAKRGVLKRTSQAMRRELETPMAIQRKWLNVDASSDGTRQPYPVVISQWNEYAEFLMFEPNELEDYDAFTGLQGLLQQQP